MTLFEIGAWFLFGGLCYSLREAEMWLNYRSPKWMKNDWWLGETKRLPWWTFQWWKDAYHFFGNLVRVALAIRLSFIYSIEIALLFFILWAAGRYLSQWYIKQ